MWARYTLCPTHTSYSASVCGHGTHSVPHTPLTVPVYVGTVHTLSHTHTSYSASVCGQGTRHGTDSVPEEHISLTLNTKTNMIYKLRAVIVSAKRVQFADCTHTHIHTRGTERYGITPSPNMALSERETK